MPFLRLTALAALLVAALAAVPAPAADDKKLGPDPKEWDRVVDKAVEYLKASQAADGSWGGNRKEGVTGVVLTGLLQTGKVKATDPVAAKALKFIESLVNKK